MNRKEFLALPECKSMFALWMDPDDKRCGWEMGEYGIEWTIGKARISPDGHWDGNAEWKLVRMHRHPRGLTVPVIHSDGTTTIEEV